MRIREIGFSELWWKQVVDDPEYCLRKIDQQSNPKTNNDKKRLTLKGLSGAFLVLGVGSSLAIAAFMVEVVHGYMKKNRNNAACVITTQPGLVIDAGLEASKTVNVLTSVWSIVEIESINSND